MSSLTRHPALDFFRLLEARAKAASVRDELQGATHLPLTQRHNGILLTIAATRQLTVTDLADRLGVSVASASRHIAALEAWGLVAKAPSSRDGRALQLILTAEGQRVRNVWGERWRRYYVDAISTMTPASVTALAVAFDRLHAGLSREPAWPDPVSLMTEETGDQVAKITAVARWMSLTILHPDYSARLCAATGLPITPPMLAILRVVSAHEGVDVAALATATHVDGSTASRNTLALARLGLVERRRDRNDGRSTVTRLTPNGRHRLLMIESAELEPIDRALSGWSPAQINDGLAAIAALTSNLNE